MRMRYDYCLVMGACLLLNLMVSCKDDQLIQVGEKEKDLRTIQFRMEQFKSQINPLRASVGPGFMGTTSSKGNVETSPTVQRLYFWSFNQGTHVADVGIDTLNTAFTLIRNNGSIEFDIGVGTAFAPYVAGQCLGALGPREMSANMPIKGVQRLGTLRFDMHSSATGPRDFDLYYSLDDGERVLLTDSNSFDGNWTPFLYDVSEITLNSAEMIHFHWVYKSGVQRVQNYNPMQGALRMDNLSLTGIYTSATTEDSLQVDGEVQYYVFSKNNHKLVMEGKQDINTDLSIPITKIKLEDGEYFLSFLVNFSDEELITPESIQDAEDLYYYQKLSNGEPITYGALVEHLLVDSDLELNLEMNRQYSQVRIEFTDAEELDEVDRIEITTESKHVFFPYIAPYLPETDWVTNEEKIIFYPDFDSHSGIQFNQFLGERPAGCELIYILKAYDSTDMLMREIRLEAVIPNNVQVVFTGKLLDSTAPGAAFYPVWNLEWGQPINQTF